MKRRIATALWTALGTHPRLFPWYVRLKDAAAGGNVARRLLFGRDTELVIEGYPRSANTYAVVAFELAQPRPVRVAHHLHAASQIVNAAKARRPVMVLIRNPREAVASLAIRSPEWSLPAALRFYIRFHRAVVPALENCFVAPYASVIGQYDVVIEELNRKFGTAFTVPPNNAQFVEKCFRRIDEIDRRTSPGGGSPTTVARPSADRTEAKLDMMDRLREPRHRAILTEAEDLFHRCLASPSVPGV